MKQLNILELLAASGPFPEYAENLMLYGQFVGSLDIAAIWHDQSGGHKQGKGEWHFDWILGGRGIQDVLFPAGAFPHQFGTTLRCYDVTTDVWHVAWMQPYGGEFVHLTGRKVGNRIVQEGVGSDPRRRERQWRHLVLGTGDEGNPPNCSLKPGSSLQLCVRERGMVFQESFQARKRRRARRYLCVHLLPVLRVILQLGHDVYATRFDRGESHRNDDPAGPDRPIRRVEVALKTGPSITEIRERCSLRQVEIRGCKSLFDLKIALKPGCFIWPERSGQKQLPRS